MVSLTPRDDILNVSPKRTRFLLAIWVPPVSSSPNQQWTANNSVATFPPSSVNYPHSNDRL